MPRITSHKLSHGGYDYEFEIGFDDEAMMESALAFEITARRIDRQHGGEVSVPARVEVDLAQLRAVVTVGGVTVGEVDLVGLDIPQAIVGEEAWARLLAAMRQMGSLDEAIQQFVPVPDPVFGCILKSGLTATLGQTIECYDRVKGSAGGFRRARRVLVCLAENGMGVLWTATQRTLRCMTMLGFG